MYRVNAILIIVRKFFATINIEYEIEYVLTTLSVLRLVLQQCNCMSCK
jgi:hypothetical protein